MNDDAPLWDVERNWRRNGEPPDWQPARYQPRAHAADFAAERYAEVADSDGDYTIVGGSKAHVRVRELGSGGPWQEFIVEGETEPVYSAYPVLAQCNGNEVKS